MAVLVCSAVLIILGYLRVGSEFAPRPKQWGMAGGARGRFKGILADLH